MRNQRERRPRMLSIFFLKSLEDWLWDEDGSKRVWWRGHFFFFGTSERIALTDSLIVDCFLCLAKAGCFVGTFYGDRSGFF